MPGDSFAAQALRLVDHDHGVDGRAGRRRAGAPHSRVRRGARPGDRPPAKDGRLSEIHPTTQSPRRGDPAGWLGLHPSIWKVASTHVVVDAYTNIYAPMLPLLMPQLGLSYAAAGTLAMCFQMANSVSQLGFGALADRWQPRTLVILGPLLAVIVLSFVGLATSALTLGIILVLGGFGGAAFHPPAAALVYRLADHRKGLAMSAHLSGRLARVSLAPVMFAPFIAYDGPAVVAADHDSRAAGAVVDAAARAADAVAAGARAIDVGDAAAGRGAADAAVFHDRAAHRDVVWLHDLRADAADAGGIHDRRSEHGGVDLPVCERRRRLHRRAAGRSLRSAPRHLVVAGRRGAVHGDRAAPVAGRALRRCWRSAACCCSQRCRSASPSRRGSSKAARPRCRR